MFVLVLETIQMLLVLPFPGISEFNKWYIARNVNRDTLYNGYGK